MYRHIYKHVDGRKFLIEPRTGGTLFVVMLSSDGIVLKHGTYKSFAKAIELICDDVGWEQTH